MGGGGLGNFSKSNTRYEGGHGKVSVCTSLDKSVHNGSLYCCVHFLVTQFKENKKAFSINNKITGIVARSPRTVFVKAFNDQC